MLPMLMFRFSHLSQRAHVWLLTGQSTHLSQIVAGMSWVLLTSPATSKSFSSFHMLFHLQFISRLCWLICPSVLTEYENELFSKPQTCQSLPSMLIDLTSCLISVKMQLTANPWPLLWISPSLFIYTLLSSLCSSPLAALKYFLLICRLGMNPRILSASLRVFFPTVTD